MEKSKKILLIFTAVFGGIAILVNLFFGIIAVDLFIDVKAGIVLVGLGIAFTMVLWIVFIGVSGVLFLVVDIIALVKKCGKLPLYLLIAFIVTTLILVVLWSLCINYNNSAASLIFSLI